MNYESFCAGLGNSLSKDAGVIDWFRQNLVQPAAQGHLDTHYRGLGTYNPSTGRVDPNTANALRAVTGAEPVLAKPSADGGRIRQGLYSLGGSRVGKWIGNKVMPESRVNDRLTSATKGALSVGGGGVQVDHSKIPGLVLDKAKGWVSNHGDMLKGLGFSAAALGLGYMAMRNRNPKPEQVAAPAGQQAAPFAGREGNTFTKYQEV